jgi:hypothetical protein
MLHRDFLARLPSQAHSADNSNADPLFGLHGCHHFSFVFQSSRGGVESRHAAISDARTTAASVPQAQRSDVVAGVAPGPRETSSNRAGTASLLHELDRQRYALNVSAGGPFCAASGEDRASGHQINISLRVAHKSATATSNTNSAAINARPAARAFSAFIGEYLGGVPCSLCTRLAQARLRRSRDNFRPAVTKLSLRQIGLHLQGIAGRTRRPSTLPTSGKATSARPSVGSAASLSRPTRSWSF